MLPPSKKRLRGSLDRKDRKEERVWHWNWLAFVSIMITARRQH